MTTEQTNIDLIDKNPVALLLVKIDEVIAACTTLKARVDIMEDHLVFLLSNSPKYLEMIQKKAEAEKAKQDDQKENKQIL